MMMNAECTTIDEVNSYNNVNGIDGYNCILDNNNCHFMCQCYTLALVQARNYDFQVSLI